jgi:hypothetical protein
LRPEVDDYGLTYAVSLMSSGEVNRIVTHCDRQADIPECQALSVARHLYPLWQQLRGGHPEEVLRIPQQLPVESSQLTLEELQDLTEVYLDAGMLRAAMALAAGKDDGDLRVWNAEYRGNKVEESAALTSLLKNRELGNRVLSSHLAFFLWKCFSRHDSLQNLRALWEVLADAKNIASHCSHARSRAISPRSAMPITTIAASASNTLRP